MHKNHQNPNDKPRTRNSRSWWTCGRNNTRKYWANYQNKRRRRRDCRLIIHEEWDDIRTLPEPHDKWMWD